MRVRVRMYLYLYLYLYLYEMIGRRRKKSLYSWLVNILCLEPKRNYRWRWLSLDLIFICAQNFKINFFLVCSHCWNLSTFDDIIYYSWIHLYQWYFYISNSTSYMFPFMSIYTCHLSQWLTTFLFLLGSRAHALHHVGFISWRNSIVWCDFDS